MKRIEKQSEYISYIQHEGYIVVQDIAYNVIVSKDGKPILLSSFKKRLTEDELCDHVDLVRRIGEGE